MHADNAEKHIGGGGPLKYGEERTHQQLPSGMKVGVCTMFKNYSLNSSHVTIRSFVTTIILFLLILLFSMILVTTTSTSSSCSL